MKREGLPDVNPIMSHFFTSVQTSIKKSYISPVFFLSAANISPVSQLNLTLKSNTKSGVSNNPKNIHHLTSQNEERRHSTICSSFLRISTIEKPQSTRTHKRVNNRKWRTCTTLTCQGNWQLTASPHLLCNGIIPCQTRNWTRDLSAFKSTC